jgi:hypothetical protein
MHRRPLIFPSAAPVAPMTRRPLVIPGGPLVLNKHMVARIEWIAEMVKSCWDELVAYRPAIDRFIFREGEKAALEERKSKRWTPAGEYSTPHHSS